MGATREVILTREWQEVDAGGDVTISPWTACFWAVTESPDPPPFTGGHIATRHDPICLTIFLPRRLWARAPGNAPVRLYVTADQILYAIAPSTLIGPDTLIFGA